VRLLDLVVAPTSVRLPRSVVLAVPWFVIAGRPIAKSGSTFF
jgi:hypothetical protein